MLALESCSGASSDAHQRVPSGLPVRTVSPTTGWAGTLMCPVQTEAGRVFHKRGLAFTITKSQKAQNLTLPVGLGAYRAPPVS